MMEWSQRLCHCSVWCCPHC